MPNKPTSHSDSSSVTLPPDVLKPGVVQVAGDVVTVKNQDLANLIHAKLAAAAQLNPAARAADTDVSVSVKVHF